MLEPCTGEDIGKMDLTKINFKHILRDVAWREFDLQVPAWIQNVMRQSERKNNEGGPGSGIMIGNENLGKNK